MEIDLKIFKRNLMKIFTNFNGETNSSLIMKSVLRNFSNIFIKSY